LSNLSVAQRSKIRRLSQPKELSPDEEGGELNIVPFLDIVVNILIFVLATVTVTFTSTIESNPPSLGGAGVRSAVPQDTLNLSVVVVRDGVSLKASGGNIAPGCIGPGPGLTVPKVGGRYDVAGIKSCAAKLKGSNPAFADEDQVSISASPDIEYEIIIQVMDALRTMPDGQGELFGNVNFQVAR
jgi:biopolymer transport protein TolR